MDRDLPMTAPLTPVERFAAEVLEIIIREKDTGSLAVAAERSGLAYRGREGNCYQRDEWESLLKRLRAAREDEEIASLRERLQALETARSQRERG